MGRKEGLGFWRGATKGAEAITPIVMRTVLEGLLSQEAEKQKAQREMLTPEEYPTYARMTGQPSGPVKPRQVSREFARTAMGTEVIKSRMAAASQEFSVPEQLQEYLGPTATLPAIRAYGTFYNQKEMRGVLEAGKGDPDFTTATNSLKGESWWQFLPPDQQAAALISTHRAIKDARTGKVSPGTAQRGQQQRQEAVRNFMQSDPRAQKLREQLESKKLTTNQFNAEIGKIMPPGLK